MSEDLINTLRELDDTLLVEEIEGIIEEYLYNRKVKDEVSKMFKSLNIDNKMLEDVVVSTVLKDRGYKCR
jgi:predicted Zn-ribbon and HTH transcriptional regulator